MKIVYFDSDAKQLGVFLPNCNKQPEARDAQLYAKVDLWTENDSEIQGIRDELRQKWSDAALRDLKEISADELMELMSVRGMELTIDS